MSVPFVFNTFLCSLITEDMLHSIQPTSLEDYTIRNDLKVYLDVIKPDYLSRNVHVWDQHGLLIPTGRRNTFFVNKLVQIYFSMYFDPNVGLVSEFNTVSAFADDFSLWSVYL